METIEILNIKFEMMINLVLKCFIIMSETVEQARGDLKRTGVCVSSVAVETNKYFHFVPSRLATFAKPLAYTVPLISQLEGYFIFFNQRWQVRI